MELGAPPRDAAPLGGMSAIDDMALSDEALEAWMAAKTARRPLVRTMSALDGFVTAAVTGPRFADPQDWMCPLMGLPRDVLAKGSATDHAVFASLARIHNRINETLFDRPQDYAPRFAIKPGGGIDPRPWCQGFHAAMNLNIKRWKRLLDLDQPQPRPAAADPDLLRRQKGQARPRQAPTGARDRAVHRARGLQRHRTRHPRPPRTPLRHPL
ncbi:UPF0149 family protein [Mesorhizobium calcicola]|uniref:UPF0149 family protein n=1 Tax=Mesorhizobium calcicola TaxID=1300310 RepID=A0ABW4WD05_9HYPH